MTILATMIRFFGWYADGVIFGGLLLFQPVGGLLLLIGLMSGALALRHRYSPTRRWLLLAWPLVTSAAVITIGMMAFGYDGDGGPPGAPDGPSRALDVVTGAHLVRCVLIVWLARGFRLLAIPPLCAGTLVFAGCRFLAVMSVTGDWL